MKTKYPRLNNLVDTLNDRNARLERENSFLEMDLTAQEILENYSQLNRIGGFKK